MSQGKTKGEALANIRAAIAGCSAVLEEGDVPISEENFETFLIMTSYKLD
jgi:predicted RNase H-like HicB family nuclease